MVVFGGVSLLFLLVPAIEVLSQPVRVQEIAAHDFNLNLGAAERWLNGEPFYPPSQLAEPFTDDGDRILYPPTALLLFGPLAAIPRGLAAVLWWGLPIAALAWQVVRLRPQPIVWPFLALCVAWPPTVLSFVVWNPATLFVACLALATLYHWPSALIAIKTGLLPFAFWGANHRSWWITLAVLAAVSVPFGSLWFEWFRVIEMSRVGGIWHSVQQFPMFFWPILVWLGRSPDAERTIGRSTV